jgi:dipeptidyl aminopeptidase/acylaminoacyl peptidase
MKPMFTTRLAKMASGCSRRAVHFALFLLTFGAFPIPLLAEIDEVLFTPQHVSRLRTVASAAISPDGKHIAYTLIVPRDPLEDENGTAWVELHVVDRNGRSRSFVTGKVAVSGVQWTPDGQHLAFLTRRGEDAYTSLYTIPIDGGEAVRRLQHSSDIQQVAFGNDGRQLAFRAVEPLAKDQQSYREKGFNQEIFEEDWRPTKVWIAAADGSGSPRALPLEGSAFDVAWSPAGPQLAVVLAPTPLVDDSYMFKRLRVVDADTGRVLQRVQNPGKLGAIAWSPDGRQLAMISGVDIHDPADGRLMIAAVPGDGSLRDLLPNDETHVNSFAWKDERTLIWAADEGTQTTVGEVDLDGNRRAMPWSNAAVFSQLTLSDDARSVALVGNSPQHPGEVFAWSVDDDAAGRLTVNNDWLAGLRFANQEVVRWNARDGLELEGVLVYPLNYQPGQRYPLIMTVHGGPEAHVSNGWVTQYHSAGQVGAARGFAVFYPNYRGSTGRGVEFTKLGQADAAGKEFDDLVDGVDHLIATGLVDAKKVGVTGGSYGGYASAWCATYYSDRFAASVMFVGISDNLSKVGTTDIPEEMYLVHHRKRLWEDWDYFLDRSPIRYVERHRTPLLILHGKDDPRVDVSQSREIHRHLKTLDQAPVRLVLYPGEGHGNRRAAARLDYNLRMMRWFEHYLLGSGEGIPPYAIDYANAWGGN